MFLLHLTFSCLSSVLLGRLCIPYDLSILLHYFSDVLYFVYSTGWFCSCSVPWTLGLVSSCCSTLFLLSLVSLIVVFWMNCLQGGCIELGVSMGGFLAYLLCRGYEVKSLQLKKENNSEIYFWGFKICSVTMKKFWEKAPPWYYSSCHKNLLYLVQMIMILSSASSLSSPSYWLS
jgi:hypothetical protein